MYIHLNTSSENLAFHQFFFLYYSLVLSLLILTPYLDIDTVDPNGGHSMVHDRLVDMKNILRAYNI